MTTNTFIAELKRLIAVYPTIPSDITDCENSEYGNYLHYCNNIHIGFDCANCTDCIYTYDAYIVKNCIDTDYCSETELCYENVDSLKCYNSDFLEYCTSVRDSAYSVDCLNCNNIFGCVGLSGKSYCIFNRQLTQEEYQTKIQQYKKWPQDKIFAVVESLKKQFPKTIKEAHNENSPYGHYIHYNKNCYMCFDAAHNEECCYIYDSHYNTTCYDMTYAAQHNELSYQIVDSFKLFNCNYAVLSGNAKDSSYIFNCYNVSNCFGCVSLTNKQYCILNRQLTKDHYESITKQLRKELAQSNTHWADITF